MHAGIAECRSVCPSFFPRRWMYHVFVPSLIESVAAYVRKHALLKPGDRVGAAVSGGADSVAMLRLLLELRKDLGIVLSVVHFNHKLRGAESDRDEQFVAEFAHRDSLELHSASADVRAFAAAKHLSLETAARDVRYDFFRRLLQQGTLNRIATAHTLDDQAETVLLRIIRGAGTRGLAGIYPQLSLDSHSSIVRPLLQTSRNQLERYLHVLNQSWREDASNRDLRHARNRIRHGILPRLERNLNPAVREALAETAEIARAEEEYWEQEVRRILPNPIQPAIKLADLQNFPLAMQRRAIRSIAEALGLRLEFRHVEEILRLARGESAELPKGWKASRKKDELCFEPLADAPHGDYEYPLAVPGRVAVPQAGSCFEVVSVSVSVEAAYNPEHLLNQELLCKELSVRNWRPGDRFRPPHTKSARKIKELLQERHLSGAEKRSWPVVVSGGEVIWVRGFAAPVALRPKNGDQAVLIREIPFIPRTKQL
jgi:tRNA(Ile)-lysidine synthase